MKLIATLLSTTAFWFTLPTAMAQITQPSAVVAEANVLQSIVPVGQPVWVDFRLFNPTDEAAVLFPRDMEELDLSPSEMGLPLSHVMGSDRARAWTIKDKHDRLLSYELPAGNPNQSEVIRLAPRSSVGVRVDVSVYCPALSEPGTYRLTWKPYAAAVHSDEVVIHIAAPKRARIETDYGPLTLKFFYEDAPHHVQNFIELAQERFYDNLTFHRLVPGYLIQGGAPGAVPAAIRPDGVILEPELNDHKYVRGTVGMARRPDDPASASCQFFICYTRWPELDGEYTAFAELVGVESYETLEKLMSVRVDGDERPLKTLYIRSVRLIDIETP